MKLGIVVNVMDSDEAGATTYRLAADAINLGHQVWIVSTGNLSYNPNDSIGAFARTVPSGKYTSAKFLKVLGSGNAINEWITLDDLDVQRSRREKLWDKRRQLLHRAGHGSADSGRLLRVSCAGRLFGF